MTTRDAASPRSRSASLAEATPSRRPAPSVAESSARPAPLSKRPLSSAGPQAHPAASYPVVSMCRRDSAVAAAPPMAPPAADSKPAVSRPMLPSEITIAAGVPLPLSAGRIFKKVAGVGAMALLAGILVVAFTRQPKGVDGGPLSSNVSNTPKTLVTQLSANPARSVRGKLGPGEGTAAAVPANAAAGGAGETANLGDVEAPHAGDTAAVAAVAVTTAAPSASSTGTPSPMRTALLTTSTTSKSKLGSSSPMKQAKYVQPARKGATAKSKVVQVKHTTASSASAKSAPWHGAKGRAAASTKASAGASAKAKTSH